MQHRKCMAVGLSAQSLKVLRRTGLASLEAHSFCRRCVAAHFFLKMIGNWNPDIPCYCSKREDPTSSGCKTLKI